MSVSVKLTAVRPANAEYKQKLKALKACQAADVEVPEELDAFFDEYENPPSDGMETSLYDSPAVTGRVEYGDGAVIDLSKLPPGTTHLRVWMS